MKTDEGLAERQRPLLFRCICPLCKMDFGDKAYLCIKVSNSKKRSLYAHCLGCDSLFFNETALLRYIAEEQLPFLEFELWTPLELETHLADLDKRWARLQTRVAKKRPIKERLSLAGEAKLPAPRNAKDAT